MKRDEILFESSEEKDTVKQRDASGSQLFTNKGKPKVFSWGDAALTANIASEKVRLLSHYTLNKLYILYISFKR